jgi:hypothetical protein
MEEPVKKSMSLFARWSLPVTISAESYKRSKESKRIAAFMIGNSLIMKEAS